MTTLAIKWVDCDGPNQVIIESWDELVEFLRDNKGKEFTIELYE